MCLVIQRRRPRPPMAAGVREQVYFTTRSVVSPSTIK